MEDLKKWHEFVLKHWDENCQFLILANKCDFIWKYPRMRQVTTEDAQSLCEKINATYSGECSVKANKNISESINAFIKQVYDVQLSLVKQGKKKEKHLRQDVDVVQRKELVKRDCVIF